VALNRAECRKLTQASNLEKIGTNAFVVVVLILKGNILLLTCSSIMEQYNKRLMGIDGVGQVMEIS